jgi:hypothetical protein
MRQRTAMVERMRRAEPAPDPEEAAAAVAQARAALRQWRMNLYLVVLGTGNALIGVTREPPVLRIMAVLLLITCVGFAVWSVLNRQAARRVLDANRRRWGDL